MRRLTPRWCHERLGNEVRLLHEAARAEPGLDYRSLPHEVLARLSLERGVDFATALFYDRVRRSPEHGPFIREVESLAPDLAALPRFRGKVLVAPAALYHRYPELGGDGLLFRQIAAEFGLSAELLPVSETATVKQGAAVVQAALQRETEPVILISLSKGGADVRLALEDGEPGIVKVRAWLQICGLVRGSPAVNGLLSGSLPWRAAVRAYLGVQGIPLDLMIELQYGPGTLLGSPSRIPGSVHVINVVGFPLTGHIVGTTNMRRRHARMAALGPNDGSTLLKDAIVEPGLVYPVWGADHCFRAPGLSLLIYRFFLYLAHHRVLE